MITGKLLDVLLSGNNINSVSYHSALHHSIAGYFILKRFIPYMMLFDIQHDHKVHLLLKETILCVFSIRCYVSFSRYCISLDLRIMIRRGLVHHLS